MADVEEVFDPAEPEVKTLMEQKAQAQGAAERKRIGRTPRMFSPVPSADPATAILDAQDDDETKPATYASGGIITAPGGGGWLSLSSPISWSVDPATPPPPPEPRRALPSHDELQAALDALAVSLDAFEIVIEGTVKSRRFTNNYGPLRGDRGELVLKIKAIF